MRIYLVHGAAGMYSDRYEWIYRAFYDPYKAQACAAELQKLCDEANIESGNFDIDKATDAEYESEMEKWKEFKKQYGYEPSYYSSVFFSVKEVELVD